MISKKALVALTILAFGVIAFAPIAETVGDVGEHYYEVEDYADSSQIIAMTEDQDNASGGNNFFYDCVLVLIIALIAAGGLHVKAHKK